jgi:hypothetical protein
MTFTGQQHDDMVSVDVMMPIYYSFRNKTEPSSIYLSKRESQGMVSVSDL